MVGVFFEIENRSQNGLIQELQAAIDSFERWQGSTSMLKALERTLCPMFMKESMLSTRLAGNDKRIV